MTFKKNKLAEPEFCQTQIHKKCFHFHQADCSSQKVSDTSKEWLQLQLAVSMWLTTVQMENRDGFFCYF